MADKISLIVTQDALKGLDELIKKLELADKSLNDLASSAVTISKDISNVKSPSTFNDFMAKNEQMTERMRLAEIKLQQAREKAFDQYEKQLKAQEISSAKEQQRLAAAQNMYNKVQAKLTLLANEYKALAIQKELTGKLDEKELKRYDFLQGKISKYDQALKAVDATMGRHQRNVGNYASAFDPLSASINQLTREMPAFANSAQTGFMAISNNLPILFDAISGILTKNKQLRAEGQPTTSILSQLAGSFFSVGTALSVGVTLLTVYGKDLVDLAFGATEAEKAQKKLAESTAELNATHTQQETTLKALNAIVTDSSMSEEKRLSAYKQMQEIMPELNGFTMEQAISTGILTDFTNQYVKASLARAKADALISEITQLNTENDKENSKSIEERTKWYEKIGIIGAKFSDLTTYKGNQEVLMRDKINKRLQNEKKTREDLVKQKMEDLKLTLAEAEGYESVLKGLQKKGKKEKEIEKDRPDIAALGIKYETKAIEALLPKLEAYKKSLIDAQKTLSRNGEEFKNWQIQIDAVQISIDKLTGTQTILDKDMQKTAENAVKYATALDGVASGMKILKQRGDEFSQGLFQDFINKSGFETTFQLLEKGIHQFGDDWKSTTNLVMESAQEMFNYIVNLSNMQFENEKSKLEAQKTLAIDYAGESTEAREKIEAEYKKKIASLEAKEAKAKQKQAIFNIVIDTAQAVMATLGKTGVLGIPLAAIVAAFGAAQVAMVMAQDIPQFAEGGKHSGGLMLVNDGKGSNYKEKIVTPNGKVISPNGRNVLMNAPAGTEIFTQSQWDQKLKEMLLSKGVEMRNQSNSVMDYEKFDNIMGKHLSGRGTQHITFDRNGFSSYISKNGNITRESDVRGSGRGIKL